jgi:hypothetical protein
MWRFDPALDAGFFIARTLFLMFVRSRENRGVSAGPKRRIFDN